MNVVQVPLEILVVLKFLVPNRAYKYWQNLNLAVAAPSVLQHSKYCACLFIWERWERSHPLSFGI